MNYQDVAARLDAQERPSEAAWAYELAIQEPDAKLHVFIDLAVLYFVCSDFGYASAKHLPAEFVNAAYERIFAVLDAAERRWGSKVEIDFWRLYIPARILGDEEPEEAYRRLAARDDALLPGVQLFQLSGGAEHAESVKTLWSIVKDATTERGRYLRSVMESSVFPPFAT
jgi:hypothetical protein